MHFELRNILIYCYLFFKLLFKGKFKEAFAHFRGVFFRIIEAITEPFSKKKVKCNYCGWQGARFKTFVTTEKIRRNAVCPKCQSLERHREFLDHFNRVQQLFDHKPVKILDIAPNNSFSDYCKKHPDIDYTSVDLQSQIAMHHMDIQDLKFDNEVFDIIVCYHVLDYVSNDVKGIQEIFRTLKTSGISISQDGIDFELRETVEFGRVVPYEEYRIRQFGRDYFDRWAKGGVELRNYDKEANILYSFKNDNFKRVFVSMIETEKKS